MSMTMEIDKCNEIFLMKRPKFQRCPENVNEHFD